MKPVELVGRAIRNSRRPGNVVLNPFGGTGTRPITAEKSGRLARLIELDPKYVDVIVRRWQDWTGTNSSCGPRYAVASWGDWSAQGASVWYWKDWIDRRFIRRFSR